MNAPAIRRQFLDFFAARGHRVVPSAPVFPQDDPTLLFTNAGMNQFKDVFLGSGTRDYARAVDTQKCIRVSGKHNDLEEVGVDTYHHTFFEMLGNWSFGDYFKAEAIAWAWELLTGVYGLPPERLWVTVFAGDEGDGLPADEEAEGLWRDSTGVDPAHVLRFGRSDNFWEMGETGPCGPCSEIHFDRGGPGANPADGADRARGVNAGNERFIEIWNLVFIQFNRRDDGSLAPLPARHVDTGMGFERLVAVLQGRASNYDTDVFAPLFAALAGIAGRPYEGGRAPADVAFRVIADHVRALAAAFADGALPANVGRGYVLRRLLRRASRYGRAELDLAEPFLWRLVPAVAETLGAVFPEIPARAAHVQTLVRAEEEAFGRTLGRGLVRFAELAGRVAERGAAALPGAEAYDLYATYGFPADLVELMARERGLAVDAAGWQAAREAHQAASRSEGRFRALLSAEELAGLPPTASTYHRAGEEATALETAVAALFAREEGFSALVLAASPFYPEAGGQVGDSGGVADADGTFRFAVEDTQRIGEVVVHLGRSEGTAAPGQRVTARVDGARRAAVRRHHTATHLLHRALRAILGDHVTQQGSYVGPDRLRFDFSHPRAVAPEEIERVEALVAAQVLANRPLATSVEDLEAARARGAMALFGEKYAERVRVVEVPGFSAELCGGTHVASTGDVGLVLVVSEGAIQAGVRRIEAVAGAAALALVQDERRILAGAARALKAPREELVARIADLQARMREARKQAGASAKAGVEAAFAGVREGLERRDGIALGFACVGLPLEGLRDLATRLKGAEPDLAAILVGLDGERVPWIAIVQGAALARGHDARKAAELLRARLGGGGGGRPELAQGQGQGGAKAWRMLEEELRAAPAAAFGGAGAAAGRGDGTGGEGRRGAR
ncbi:MAG: alanine--tRNA ligase [Planctomycetota bacterium]